MSDNVAFKKGAANVEEDSSVGFFTRIFTKRASQEIATPVLTVVNWENLTKNATDIRELQTQAARALGEILQHTKPK